MCCVCVFSLRLESLDMILGDEPLISEVVLSQAGLAVTHASALEDIPSVLTLVEEEAFDSLLH